MIENKLMPNDEELEKVVLGAMIYSNVINDVVEILTPETFYNTFHADVYRAVISLHNQGIRPDNVLVLKEMIRLNYKADPYRLVEMGSYSIYDIRHHAIILSELQKRRELIVLSHRINALSYDQTQDVSEIITELENAVKDVASDKRAVFLTMKDTIASVFKQIEKNNAVKSELTGSPTGFSKFDERSGGLQKSDLIIIAGETSQGKSALSVTMALNASSYGKSIAIYSMEMTNMQITARMMSIKSGVPANQIMFSRLMPEQFESIDKGISTLYDRTIYFDDRSTSNIDTIISSIRTLKKRYDIDGVIIDYLQILNVNMKGVNLEQQMGDVARRLKNLAKELDIWIIALSQLNRDNANPKPTIARLRASGQIAEAADVVMLVYRPEYYGREYEGEFKNRTTQGTALIDVVKGRNIGLLKFICGFDSNTTKFYEIDDIDSINMKNIEYDDVGKPIPF